jgi:hypothetical protein
MRSTPGRAGHHRMLPAGIEERRPPAFVRVARERQVEALVRHSILDPPDAGPGVEPIVERHEGRRAVRRWDRHFSGVSRCPTSVIQRADGSRVRREQHFATALCRFRDRFSDLVEPVGGGDRSRDRAGGDQRRQTIEHRRDVIRLGKHPGDEARQGRRQGGRSIGRRGLPPPPPMRPKRTPPKLRQGRGSRGGRETEAAGTSASRRASSRVGRARTPSS